MHKLLTLFLAGIATSATVAAAQDNAQPTKATYSITGLHCPPCTRTVESSLKRVKGVRSAKLDWNSKTAKVEFDESALAHRRLLRQLRRLRT